MKKFIPIPAIDLLNNECVRLTQGDFQAVTKYSTDPLKIANDFITAGAKRIHVIDLDGAKQDEQNNRTIIKSIIKLCKEFDDSIEIQIGGGIRNFADIEELLNINASYLILGTAVINDRNFLQEICTKYPQKIILGLDAKDGKLAIDGWQTTTNYSVIDFANEVKDLAIAAIIYTDILKDGLLTGPNITTTQKLADLVACPVFASGGISAMKDINKLQATNIAGAIIGRAIYTGAINVNELYN